MGGVAKVVTRQGKPLECKGFVIMWKGTGCENGDIAQHKSSGLCFSPALLAREENGKVSVLFPLERGDRISIKGTDVSPY